MPNSLTRHVGLNAGPWLLETLVKHYFDQFFAETKSKAKKSELLPGAGGNANIRREELLYDEAFHIVKVSNTSVVVHGALMTNIELLKGVPGGRFSVSATSTSSLCTYSFTTLATP